MSKSDRTVHKLIYSPSSALLHVLARSISKHQVSGSPSLTGLFAAYLEAVAWKFDCGGDLKESLIAFYWCGQGIEMNRTTKRKEKKSSQPLNGASGNW